VDLSGEAAAAVAAGAAAAPSAGVRRIAMAVASALLSGSSLPSRSTAGIGRTSVS
jgi:hypothetical protein